MKVEDGFIAETERLYLREIVETDAAEAFDLNSDPEVLRYTGDEPFSSVEEAAEFLKNYTHYKTYGFGRWAVIRKSDASWLGWCGLKFSPETNEFDIGYRLKKQYWNLGYATEAAKLCLHLAFEKYEIEELVGNVDAENTGSIKVLEKLGLRSAVGEGRSAGELKFKIDQQSYFLLKNGN